jgi:hypothetical protein
MDFPVFTIKALIALVISAEFDKFLSLENYTFFSKSYSNMAFSIFHSISTFHVSNSLVNLEKSIELKILSRD